MMVLRWTVSTLVLAAAIVAMGQQDLSQEAYRTLEGASLWTHPSAAAKVDGEAIKNKAREIAPVKLKVLVVPQLSQKWFRNGKEARGTYGKWLMKDRLKMSNGIVIVYTKHGVTAYSDKVPESRLASLSTEAAGLNDKNNFTTAIVTLADSVYEAGWGTATTSRPLNSTGSTQTQKQGGGMPLWIPLGVLGVGAAGGYWLVRRGQTAKVKANAEEWRRAVVDGISYLDSYDGMLEDAEKAEHVRSVRDEAAVYFDQGVATFDQAKKKEDYESAARSFRLAWNYVDTGKSIIHGATGGTDAAFRLHRELAEIDTTKAPVFEQTKGSCYFTGKPDDGDLVPVEITVSGQRRTVWASQEVAERIGRGEEPVMAGRQTERGFMPWYEDRNWSYGRGSFVGDLIMWSAISHMFQPFHTVHHHHYSDGGGWGGGQSDSGSNWASSDLDNSGDFGSSGGGWGDSGGGDFGSGDFGGGGDSGGGDFGGGDF